VFFQIKMEEMSSFLLGPAKGRLRVTQEGDYNTCYGVATVVINEDDIPTDDRW